MLKEEVGCLEDCEDVGVGEWIGWLVGWLGGGEGGGGGK